MTVIPRSFPVLPADSLSYLVGEVSPAGVAVLALGLQGKQLDRLVIAYRRALQLKQRKSVWFLAQELTRRGIPPTFRPSPFFDNEPLIPIEDIFLQDLHWIAVTYPKQSLFFKSWRGVLNPQHFWYGAAQAIKNGLRQPSFYLRALVLSDDQQTECVYCRGNPIRRRMDVIDHLSSDIQQRLKVAHMARPRARAQSDPRKTIQRRHDVWRCGSMAEWYPARTAHLYEALTGIPMTRSLASKIIEEVCLDVPDARPLKRLRRRKSAASVTWNRKTSPTVNRTTKAKRGRLTRKGVTS